MGLFSTTKTASAARRSESTARSRHSRGASTGAPPLHPAPPANSASSAVYSRPCRFVASARRLGSGAYGTVLHGKDLATDAPVAIKLIPDGRMKATSLDREIAMLRKLSETGHPALLRFHGHIRPDGVRDGAVRPAGDVAELPLAKPLGDCHALVMEVAEGGEVFEHVVKCDGMAESELGPVFTQLIDAVGAAHALGVAHRDLKLENVLLAHRVAAGKGAARRSDGEPLRIKLIDWGLAHQHAVDNFTGHVVPERLYSRCGSRSYMAPEVTNRDISGTVGYDAFLADVWSLGVCLFAMLLGFFPFEQANPALDWRARKAIDAQKAGRSVMATIFGFYPEKPLAQGLTTGVIDLLDRMLVFDPSQRATLAEVCASEWIAPHAGWLTGGRLPPGMGISLTATASDSSTFECPSVGSTATRHTASTSSSSCSVSVASVSLVSLDLTAPPSQPPSASKHASSTPSGTPSAPALPLDERQSSASTVASFASSACTAPVAAIPPHRPSAAVLPPPPPSPVARAPAEVAARAGGAWGTAALEAAVRSRLPEKRRSERRSESRLPEKRRSDELDEYGEEPTPTVVVAGGRQQQRAERFRQQLARPKGEHRDGGRASAERHSGSGASRLSGAGSSSRRLAALLSKACLRPRAVASEASRDSPRASFGPPSEASAYTAQL